MWDLPGPGIEPMSPALAGGFFTAEPPGKPMLYEEWPKNKKIKKNFFLNGCREMVMKPKSI